MFFRILVCAFLLFATVGPSRAESGGGLVGNAGDTVTQEFWGMARQLYRFLRQSQDQRIQNLITVEELVSFDQLVNSPDVSQRMDVLVQDRTFLAQRNGRWHQEVDEKEYLRRSRKARLRDTVKEVSAINFPSIRRIKVSRLLWEKKTYNEKLALVHHEIMGLIRNERDQDYEVSPFFLEGHYVRDLGGDALSKPASRVDGEWRGALETISAQLGGVNLSLSASELHKLKLSSRGAPLPDELTFIRLCLRDGGSRADIELHSRDGRVHSLAALPNETQELTSNNPQGLLLFRAQEPAPRELSARLGLTSDYDRLLRQFAFVPERAYLLVTTLLCRRTDPSQCVQLTAVTDTQLELAGYAFGMSREAR